MVIRSQEEEGNEPPEQTERVFVKNERKSLLIFSVVTYAILKSKSRCDWK